jgi:Right handed beta helix region
VNHPAVSDTCYTNAIDGVTDARWIVRDNFIHDIRCQDLSLAGPAILLWQGSSDTLVERNTITNSSRGISLGLTGTADHSNGIARNNFIHWDAAANYAVDVPIYTTSPNSELLNNTVLTAGKYPNAIEVRYVAGGVKVTNNLLDATIQPRDGAIPTLSNNLVNAQPAWFVNPAIGDLHLKASATAAIGHATALAHALDDFDAQTRPGGANQSDIGADQTLPDEIFKDGFGG